MDFYEYRSKDKAIKGEADTGSACISLGIFGTDRFQMETSVTMPDNNTCFPSLAGERRRQYRRAF